MSESSNIEQVIAALDAFAHSITFTRPGREGALGKSVAMTVIRGPDAGAMGGIMGRCSQEMTPEGNPWPKNSDNPAGKGYASRKEKLYGWSETNRRTGTMLSQVALYGRTRIEPEVVTLVYGEDKAPDASYAPSGYLSNQDQAVTDIQKATWAHAAGRGFFGLGQGDPENVHAVCQEAVGDMIREANGG